MLNIINLFFVLGINAKNPFAMASIIEFSEKYKGIIREASIVVLMIFFFIVLVIALFDIRFRIPKLLSNIIKIIKGLFSSDGASEETVEQTFEELLDITGYSYDEKQDIFYSNMNAWQRKFGYCRLYDEAAAPWGMIIDCEPIYFEYENKNWLIEFWKGQYDMTTGCEIGVYTSKEKSLVVPSVFDGTFYECVADDDLLDISCTLMKNGKTILKRSDKHWWLTGFKLGEFSQPSDLSMSIRIIFKDNLMRNAFVEALKKAGYKENEIIVYFKTVSLNFDKPYTTQPFTRTKKTDWIIQKKNKKLCSIYRSLTKEYDNMPDKIKAIQIRAPEIYKIFVNISKVRQLFGIHAITKKKQ